jgi:hypothetical protein
MTYAEAARTVLPALTGEHVAAATAARMRQWHTAERRGCMDAVQRFFAEQTDAAFWLASDTNEFADAMRGE